MHELDGVRMVQMLGPWLRAARRAGVSPDELLARLRFLEGQSFDVIIHCFEHRPTVALPARFLRLQKHRKHTVLVRDWADLWGGNGYAHSRTFLMRQLSARWTTTANAFTALPMG
ncbi:MAG: hypothetical protein R3A10_02180 [Caldilineaceae bacterium]